MFLDPPLWANILAGLSLAILGVCAYAYVGYPFAAYCFFREKSRDGEDVELGAVPKLSVLLAARNEAGVIRQRIENLLDQDYPVDRLEVLVVSDASDDGTDAIVLSFADPRVRLFRQEQRQGKTAGINLIGAEATGTIFVQTDANVFFAPGTLAALARAFADPSVGVAIGEVSFTNEDDPLVASGEGLYWQFETWTKHVEAQRGLLAVANGGIYALRRHLWRSLPVYVAGDAAEPLLAAREGYCSVVAPGALAFERAAASHGEEYERKVRIIAQQVACAKWLGVLSLPGRTAWAYVSHKLLRYAVPFIAVDAFCLALAATLGGSPWGLLALLLILGPLAAALLALLPWPGPIARIFRIPLYLVVINLAAASGVLRGLTGNAQPTWEVPRSTRENSQSQRPRSS